MGHLSGNGGCPHTGLPQLHPRRSLNPSWIRCWATWLNLDFASGLSRELDSDLQRSLPLEKKKKRFSFLFCIPDLFFPPMLVNSFIQHRGCFNMKELFLGLLRMKTEINAINHSLLLWVYKAVQITCVNALFISFFCYLKCLP